MRYQKFILGVLAVSLLSGCASIHGATLMDKRNYVLNMRQTALDELYALEPYAEYQIKESKGFAVFSNINSHLFLISGGSGYGVVTDRSTGEETYMRMFSLGAGLGFGAKDYRAIIVFKNEDDLARFTKGGWDFSGQMDAAMKSSEKGGSATGARSLDPDIIIYQLTEAGLIIHATLQGTKYYRYHELN